MLTGLTRVRAWKIWSVWDAARLTKLGDLALRLVAIVAAVAALNLFTLKPSLRTIATCSYAINVPYLRGHSAPEKNVMPLAIKYYVSPRNRLVVVPLRDPKGGLVPLDAPDFFFLQGLATTKAFAQGLSHADCSPISYLAFLQALRYDEHSRGARGLADNTVGAALLAEATFAQVRVVVDNNGRGSAKNVRVQPAENYVPAGAVPIGIALAPGEHSGPILYQGPVVGSGLYGTGIPKTEFRAYGESSPTVDEVLLLWIGLGLFLGIFVPAVIAEVIRREPPSSGS